MSERRRPWWTDDLIEAVSAAVVRMQHPEVYPSADIHAVIAAVEDWQESRWDGISESPREVIERLHELEAQIQAVRELHRKHDDCPPDFDCAGYGSCRGCGKRYPCQTIRALDGEQ